jgi:small-conductance mechanosensitive channel
VDLHERHQLDMAQQVASKVRAKARPWRSLIALALACCGFAAAELGRHLQGLDYATMQALKYCGAAAVLVFGAAAVFGLSGQVRAWLRPIIGAAHAGVTRYALVLAGIFTVLVIALNVATIPVGQLVLGGAVTGVLLGIAAQQSLSNLFAGMVLLFARPFRVGDRVRLRAGALYGILDGTVTDISITYVRLETAEGVLFVPNSQALAAVVGPVPADPAVPPLSDPDAARAAAADGHAGQPDHTQASPGGRHPLT